MSKILLLGEYSGLHTNLKEGLVELGHEVKIASNGEGKKNITGDINLVVNSKNKISNIVGVYKLLSSFSGYEAVQFINPYITYRLGSLFYKNIFQKNKKVYCLAAGDDAEFMKFTLSGKMKKYSPFDEYLSNLKLDKRELSYTSQLDSYLHKRFMNKVDGVIPIMWEYAESYRNSNYANKLTSTIPLPINTNSISYEKNSVKNKVVFYHASNRPDFKGSPYIIEAMKRFQNMYPNDVEMIYADFLPLNEYLEVMSKANVIIDQCRSYSYGMNALYAMAKGKIVMSGAEPEAVEELGMSDCPVLNITPDVDQIVDRFKQVLLNRDSIEVKGQEARFFVEQKHNHVKIAERYLEAWNL